jgi:hypothetical protein
MFSSCLKKNDKLSINQDSNISNVDIALFIDWPKPLLQLILHFASCLTLFEDLPYLRALADKNIGRLFKSSRASNHETALLFKRFVELYGSSGETTKLLEGSKER